MNNKGLDEMQIHHKNKIGSHSLVESSINNSKILRRDLFW